jgi:hypothetical protein
MKKHYRRFAPLLLPLIATGLLASCVVPAHEGDGYYSSGGGGHVVYTTLPGNYVGDAYYYNGRYYSGGRYQTGRYHDGGRSYTSRYYYNGQYYYGGNYQRHAAKTARQDQSRDRERQNRRDETRSQRPSERADERPSQSRVTTHGQALESSRR